MNILNKLTIKHLKMNKKRTIVSIIGIILSTALMVGIGLLMSTMRENMIDMVKMDNGAQHVTLYNINHKDYEYIKKSDKVEKVLLTEKIGYAKQSENENNFFHYVKVLGGNKDFLNTIRLKEGRFPENSNEIIIPNINNLQAKSGDTITLEIGERSLNGEILEDNVYQENEEEVTLINPQSKSYKIVGIIDYDCYQNYNDVGSFVYTYQKDITQSNKTLYVYFENMSDVKETVNTWTKELKLDSESQININKELLGLYGESSYKNFMDTIIKSLVIILVILSIACIIVIYNSFAISVMERKKQFGLLSSIGTTRKQIRKTVFFEAFVVGTIGIVLGILGAYIGIGCVLAIINHLLPDMFGSGTPLKLVTYPVFIIIPIIFMIATILISAFLPARSASRITPIEAIRLNDDIKIKGKKVKTPKWIRKLFGMEGEIALKNMKRNKKKYRITVLSLFVSIVLFISFSGYMKYMFSGIDSYTTLPEYDAILTIFQDGKQLNSEDNLAFKKEVQKNKEVKKSFAYTSYYLSTSTNLSKKEYYTDKFYDLERTGNIFEQENVFLLEIEEDTYQSMLKTIGKTEVKPIIYNHYETVKYSNNTRKSYSVNKYSSKFDAKIKLCETIYDDEKESYDCKLEVDDYYIADIDFFGKDSIKGMDALTIIIPMNYFGDITEFNNGTYSEILYSIDDDKDLVKDIEKQAEKYKINYNYTNLKEELRLMRNLVFCVKLLVYGFITLVTLIGVTSVFNTINTSIHLRRKEFAMLRSMGLSSHGFNKILLFESLFFGLKSLLYALPVSCGVIYLLYLSFKEMTDFDMILIPYDSILIAVVGVFIIIIISTIYATRKIRKENILEAIREENI